MNISCPCCSGKKYADCCEPYHKHQLIASTPEALMRSRYAAYALVLIPYLLETTHQTVRALYSTAEMKKWAVQNTWKKLEIVKTEKDIVEFKAFYNNGLKEFIHHEISTFKKEHGVWYYLNGTFPH